MNKHPSHPPSKHPSSHPPPKHEHDDKVETETLKANKAETLQAVAAVAVTPPFRGVFIPPSRNCCDT
jgi:hypothetical protein